MSRTDPLECQHGELNCSLCDNKQFASEPTNREAYEAALARYSKIARECRDIERNDETPPLAMEAQYEEAEDELARHELKPGVPLYPHLQHRDLEKCPVCKRRGDNHNPSEC